MIGRLLLLVGGSLVFAAAGGLLAWALFGDEAGVFLATCVGLCLVPAVMTFLWVERAFRSDPGKVVHLVIVGTVFRVFAVLALGAVLNWTVPYFSPREFWLWLVVAYLFSLTWEVALILARPQQSTNPPSAPTGR